jgi:hypothetical protein
MKDNKEKQPCNLCAGLVEDISQETSQFRRDFKQIVKNLDCQKHYVCLPLARIADISLERK